MMKSLLQPIDRTALALMAVLSFLIVVLISNGTHSAPRVRDFSWQNKYIGAEDVAFTLTFSRPMDHVSAEANLKVEPLLPGKISWAGRRMAYTLTAPAPYGTKYKLEMKGAIDRFNGQSSKGSLIEPFVGNFSTRDLAFVYVGVEGEEQGRLILYNLTKQKKRPLTPKDLSVMEFKPFPNGERILFSASNIGNNDQGILQQQLYTVTTGLDYSTTDPTDRTDQPPIGRIDLILDSKNYQNLKFDLSSDGKKIVIQRLNRRNPSEFGLWIVNLEGKDSLPKIQRIETQPGGDFVITPDSSAIAIAQGQGIAILPIPEQTNSESTVAVKPMDFLPQFGMVLGFTKNGSTAAMVKFNTDYTRSLFLVTNQGEKKELFKTNGSVLSCQFHPQAPTLYCLMTKLLEGKEYQEEPYLAAIDLNTSKVTPLLVLPKQRDIQMSLSPDGLAIIFDQLITSGQSTEKDALRTNEGQAITTSRLWFLPLASPIPQPNEQIPPKELPLPGFHPRWLP